MRHRNVTRKPLKRSRRRVVRKGLYWYLSVLAEGSVDVAAKLRGSGLAVEVAYAPSKVPCFRVPRSAIDMDGLGQLVPGMDVSKLDSLSFLHRVWKKLNTVSK